MSEADCPTCGARARHQRLIERRCEWCEEFFVVLSDKSRKRFCDRRCQLWAAGERRAKRHSNSVTGG